jgi:recombination protein RecT
VATKRQQQQRDSSEDKAIAKRGASAIMELLQVYQERVVAVMAQKMPFARVEAAVQNAIHRNYQIAGCKRFSVFNAVVHCYAMGLEIRPNEAYLVPYKGECQLIIDYRGKIMLATRAGVIQYIDPVLVRDHDQFSFDRSRDRIISHVPFIGQTEDGRIARLKSEKDQGEVVGGYCETLLAVGTFLPPRFTAWWELDKIHKSSKVQSEKGPWTQWRDQMELKSLVHREYKRLPTRSVEMNLSDIVDQSTTVSGEKLGPIIDVTAEDIDDGDEPLDEAVESEGDGEDEDDDMPQRRAKR